MADSNNKGGNDSVFSWSNEFEAYSKKQSRNNGQTNQQNTYGTDRFSRYNPSGSQTRRGSASRNQDYRYEYPGDDYKYTPRSDYYESQRQTDYFTGEFDFDTHREKSGRQSAQNQGRNQAQNPKKRTASKKNGKGTSSDTKKTGKKKKADPNGRKNGAQAPKKPSGKTVSKNAEAQNRRKPKAPTEAERTAEARRRHKEKARREKEFAKEKVKLEKANKRIKKLKKQGFSSDEIRAILQREQKRGRLIRSLLVVIAVIIAIMLALSVVAVVKGLPIGKIEINGSKHYKYEEILDSAEISVGDNMILISEESLNEKLSVKRPYIESVKVKKILPDTLRITVKETKEKLLLETKKGFICLDKNGKVVSEKKQAAKDGKIKVVGFASQKYEVGKKFVPDEESGNSRKYAVINEILTALNENKIEGCNFIDVSDLSIIELGCKNKMKIYVDTEVDYGNSFGMLSQQLKKGEFNPVGSHYYDLRFNGQIVYKEGELSKK